jgi:hypothetical protein
MSQRAAIDATVLTYPEWFAADDSLANFIAKKLRRSH